MDTAQWPQEIVVKPLEEIIVTNTTTPQKPSMTSSSSESCKKVNNPQKEVQQQVINCPRSRSWSSSSGACRIEFLSAPTHSWDFPLNTDQYHQFMKPVPALSFSLDNELEIGTNTGSNGTGRHLFPFEDLKLQAPGNAANDRTSDDHRDNAKDHGGDEQSNGFGME
ncbi:hypothetical protein AG4045_013769, partial [Apium graveolens]